MDGRVAKWIVKIRSINSERDRAVKSHGMARTMTAMPLRISNDRMIASDLTGIGLSLLAGIPQMIFVSHTGLYLTEVSY
jgi:hypothetical protein